MRRSPPWPSLFSLHLTLLLVQLTVVPIGAQIQAPSCLPAVMGTWNWVCGSFSVTSTLR